MEELKEEHRKELIKILNILNHCRSAPKNEDNINLLIQTIKNTFNWITLHGRSKETEKELIFQVLEYLLILKKDNELTKVFEDYKLQYLVDINLAYYIQILPGLGRNNSENITNSIRVLITYYKRDRTEKKKNILGREMNLNNISLNEEEKKLDKKKNFELTEKKSLLFENIKFEYTIVKNYLQLAASNSQMEKNIKSIKCGKRAIYYFSKMVTNLNCIFTECKKNKDQEGLILESNSELKNNFDEFFNFIIKMNNLVLSSLKKLETNNFNLHNFFLEIHEIEKLLKKKSFKSPWMKNISIANFMHVEYFTYKKISHMITFNEIFTEGFLSLNLMLISTIYFMIATENRLICFKENDMGKNNFKIKPIFEKTHFEKIKKTKKFIFSEKLHNFSVKLLKNYFEPNLLINHFVNSYSENYEKKMDLEKIIEEESFYNKSFINTYRSSCIEYSMDNGYMDYSNVLIDQSNSIILKEKFSGLNLKKKVENNQKKIEKDLEIENNVKLETNFDILCKSLKKLPKKILNSKNLKKEYFQKTNEKNEFFIKKNFLKKNTEKKKLKKNFLKNLKINLSKNTSLNEKNRNNTSYRFDPNRSCKIKTTNSKKLNYSSIKSQNSLKNQNYSSLKFQNSLQNLNKKKIYIKRKSKQNETTHKKNLKNKKNYLSKKKFILENPNFESSKTIKKLSVSKISSKNKKDLFKIMTEKATKRMSTKKRKKDILKLNQSFSKKKNFVKKKNILRSYRLSKNKILSYQNFSLIKDPKFEKLNFLKQRK